MTMNDDELQERFAQKIKFAPSREWVNSYFDLVKQVLDITGLKNDDPRLTMSLSPNKTSWHFPVSINFRYVIAMQKRKIDGQDKYFVGLIFASYCRDIPELSRDRRIKESWKFSNLRGEFSETPYFLRFDNLYEAASLIASSEQVKQCWHDALIAEVNRAKSSTFRKFHQPKVYNLVTDKNFRAEILDMAYSESKPILGLLPDEIDEPQEFYEGAVKSIKVNAFERSQKARNTCVEHYGAKCEICGMTFESRYGEVGKGFIHVHHLKPLGEIGAEYEVDPINDLRPVCPNCHAILHMRKPPYSIDEVKVMIKAQESYSGQVA